jgi:GTP pyrophosphokinase
VYLALGRSELPIMTIINYLTPLLVSRGEIKTSEVHRKPSPAQSKQEQQSPIAVKLAHCCCPLPGDSITGEISPNKGVIVHRSDCRNLRRYRTHESERLIEIKWLQIESQHYLVPITVIAHDRSGLVRDVATVVADYGINMIKVSTTTNSSLHKATINATLEIDSLDQIDPIFERLKQVKHVVSVSRDLGQHTS